MTMPLMPSATATVSATAYATTMAKASAATWVKTVGGQTSGATAAIEEIRRDLDREGGEQEADQATLEDAADRMPHAVEELLAQVAEGGNTHLASFLYKLLGVRRPTGDTPTYTRIRGLALIVGF